MRPAALASNSSLYTTAFRSKLLELCKTRAKESSPDNFNFYVVLAGCDKISDPGRATAGASSKPHHYKQNVQKVKHLPKTWVLRGKSFEDFRRKKGNIYLDLSKAPSGKKGLERVS